MLASAPEIEGTPNELPCNKRAGETVGQPPSKRPRSNASEPSVKTTSTRKRKRVTVGDAFDTNAESPQVPAQNPQQQAADAGKKRKTQAADAEPSDIVKADVAAQNNNREFCIFMCSRTRSGPDPLDKARPKCRWQKDPADPEKATGWGAACYYCWREWENSSECITFRDHEMFINDMKRNIPKLSAWRERVNAAIE